MNDGIDIDTAVKEVFTDASRRGMDFSTAVELDVVNRRDNNEILVQMLVSEGKEDFVILGTTAIPSMGYQVKKSLRGPREKTSRQREETESNPVAVVKQRVFIAPGPTKYVDLKCEEEWSEAVLSTKNKRIPNGLYKIGIDVVTKVAVVNTSDEPMVMRKGQQVGEWENAYCD
ncbi:hypothetical protein V3C99_018177 [Haemonchus contortus]|uniref:Transposase_23 domain-containing protein n=1 Tax=Haemonchus contortus TaxID=6289 RepID=A0A7I4Z1L9_HAECO|nr:unnamed protein product [Haemonchus contortus]